MTDNDWPPHFINKPKNPSHPLLERVLHPARWEEVLPTLGGRWEDLNFSGCMAPRQAATYSLTLSLSWSVGHCPRPPLGFTTTITITKVLSEYPEVKMTDEKQEASLGETYPELMKSWRMMLFLVLVKVRRLPCKGYVSLASRFSGQTENLLVTSTLAACTDPHPLATQKQDETDKASPNQQHRSNSEQNGVQQSTAADGDEIVAEIETDWR
ncbi:unnamed protein product [Linum tenue]|uniref:Uncharacterized protein n=1 Tax=Linum tenue TaxID=586396 RepID=A0AAV0I1T8_9ROSI|nr:unnamed protein product [Linum tenue]